MNSNDLAKELWQEAFVEALKQYARATIANPIALVQTLQQIDNAKQKAKILNKIVEDIQRQNQQKQQQQFIDYLKYRGY